MKSKTPDLTAALLLGLAANTLLRTQSGYWARAGLLAVLPAALLVLAAAWLFTQCRGVLELIPLRWAFCALLAYSSVLELLRLWRLFGTVYPSAVTLFGICATVLLPVIYLRRGNAIGQTANVLLVLLGVATAFMLLSVAPRLLVTNLQAGTTNADVQDALRGQAVLYPELLLPALWCGKEPTHKTTRTLALLAGFSAALDAGAHLLLELFFGMASAQPENPVHSIARTGALSVFHRMEWIQLLLWSAIVTIKLAVYLYAIVRLGGGRNGKTADNAVGLDRFPAYFAVMAFLCLLLKSVELAQAFAWRNIFCWVLAGVTVLGGAVKWLLKKPNSA